MRSVSRGSTFVSDDLESEVVEKALGEHCG